MNIDVIACVAHNVNKAYCESLGDFSQDSWETCPAWQKTSAINGVKFHLKNPEALASASHDSWLKEKVDSGWQWGPVKNPELRIHPCILPFEDLPKEQQTKDYLFKAVVDSLRNEVV